MDSNLKKLITMFDLKDIRLDPETYDKGWEKRGLGPQTEKILGLEKEQRALVTKSQELMSWRNEVSREVGNLKKAGKDASALQGSVGKVKQELQKIEDRAKVLTVEMKTILSNLPNIPHPSVPLGADEENNVVVRTVGEPTKFDFEPKHHFDLGEALGLMDFEKAANMSGARFVILKGALARLERALGQFMINLHVDTHGYEECFTPCLVKANALYGTGQLPKFEDDLFKTGEHYLIPTAEVTLSNIHRDSILPSESLPIRYTALTQCFRAEAGSAGRDTRGMIRQHQFEKVEMVTITTLDKGLEELERMTGAAEAVLSQLGLAYQVLELCAGDMGFSARKTYDLEVWVPGEGKYREISSCSACGSFQSRRMNMRHRPKGEKQTQFVATLNGSGVAVGRALVAVMENYQQADGSIVVPDVLKPYMGGIEVITAS
jgi:seryl-tRNA synthetase